MKRFRASLSRFAALTALSSVAIATAPSAQATVPNHLYVCITGGKAQFGSIARGAAPPRHLYLATSSSSGYVIMRYPLVNGFPAQKPDLMIPGVVSPMAVDDDGTLYATQPFASTFGVDILNTYPFGATQPSRQTPLPNPLDLSRVNALAAGPGGYMYAGYVSYISQAAFVPNFGQRPFRGMAVLGPHDTIWRLVYAVPGTPGGPDWMQFGPQRELYVAGSGVIPPHKGGHIYTLERPWEGFNLHQNLDTVKDIRGITFSGETTDMYVLRLGTSQDDIAVYHRGAHNHDRPFRTFNIAGAARHSIAIVGKNLFLVENSLVLAYPKDATGSPKPTFSRSYPFSTYEIAVGP